MDVLSNLDDRNHWILIFIRTGEDVLSRLRNRRSALIFDVYLQYKYFLFCGSLPKHSSFNPPKKIPWQGSGLSVSSLGRIMKLMLKSQGLCHGGGVPLFLANFPNGNGLIYIYIYIRIPEKGLSSHMTRATIPREGDDREDRRGAVQTG